MTRRTTATLCAVFVGVSAIVTVVSVAQDERRSTEYVPRGSDVHFEDGARQFTMEQVADLRGRPENGPDVGEQAPDFALTPLKFYEFNIDETEITEDNAGKLYDAVRLSDFQGKKPVALIFGSYT
jgi:hypothetical protein